MRHVTLEVPSEAIGEFTEKMIELELENSIFGKNDDDEIEIEVHYEKNESKQVDELESFLETLIDSIEDEDGENEEEDDDDE